MVPKLRRIDKFGPKFKFEHFIAWKMPFKTHLCLQKSDFEQV